MSTCTLQNIAAQHSMNEQKDLSRPPSGSMADLEEGPASKRIKVDERAVSMKTSPSNKPCATSVHIEVAPSVSIESSSKRAATSSSSDATPQATTTSISEGSSELSLEARHALSSRPSSTAQLQTTTSSEPTRSTTTVSTTAAATSSNATFSNKKSALHPSSQAAVAPAPAEALPIKSLTMMHLHQKYTAELDYMLREFRKLERQLLGAKGNGVEENAGSRERREKLHSFILHLENTLDQIQLGVSLEAEGKSTVMVGVTVGGDKTVAPSAEQVKQQLADSGALANLTKEKEEEENVQKLEEHILANLLPVKVRLKKQLAAQQGASRNPVGMPVARRGMTAAEKSKGTFAAAAEKKRQQAEAAAAEKDETQFGKPLTGGASSLTQKLHGQTLGSSKRKYGHGVGSAVPTVAAAAASTEGEPAEKRKILYAGMAPGSKQLKSGVSAASGAHKMVIETPSLYSKSAKPQAKVPERVSSAAAKPPSKAAVLPQHARAKSTPNHPGQKLAARQAAASKAAKKQKKRHDDPNLTEEERKKLRKIRKRKKRRQLVKKRERERQLHMLRQQQSAQVSNVPKMIPGKKGKMMAKGLGKKKGPRTVEYICSLCSEAYMSTCDCNPWWALTHHECPKCRKGQVPRVDITSPANAIEYHPALLAHAEEGASGGGGSAGNGPGVMHINPSHIPSSATFPLSRRYPVVASDSDSGSDLSDISDGDLSDDSIDLDFDELDNIGTLSPAEQAENESFGAEYNGPKLSDEEMSRLLVLMSHASSCPGRHKSVKHRDVCSSVKYMMLHVRDCPGTTASFDICPFPWCRKVKHSLYHLVSCVHPNDCSICSPAKLSPNLGALIGLNDHRRKKQRERRAAAMAAAAAAAKAKPPPRSAPKAKSAATAKNMYKQPATKPGTARHGPAAVARKGPMPASGVPRATVPAKVSAPVSTQSAVATAAAAAAAAKASGVSKVPLVPAKSVPAPVAHTRKTATPMAAKLPAVTKTAPVPRTTGAAASFKAPTVAPVAASAPQKLAPPLSVAATTQPATVLTTTVVAPQKSALAIAAEAAKLQVATSNASADNVVVTPTTASTVQPTVAAAPPCTQRVVVANAAVEAAVRTTAQAATKPSSGVKPRAVTEESVAKAATFPKLPPAVSTKLEPSAVTVKAGSEEPVVMMQVETETANVNSEPNARVKGPDSPLLESTPSTAALSAEVIAAGASIKMEHDAEDLFEGFTVDSTPADVFEQMMTEEKPQAPTQSPDSAELSRSSSCSDEVKKNEDVVRVGSC